MTGWGLPAWGPGGGPGGGDVTPPVVVFNPVTGTPISPSQIIQVTVTDLFLKRVQLTAEYPSGYWEVIWMQGRFAPRFVSQSTRQVVLNGFTFHLKRTGNWPETPNIHCDPYDTSANETP